MEPLYSRLYVHTALELEELLKAVADCLAGEIDRDTVVAPALEADVRRSDDFDEEAVQRDPSDFIHYRYSVEVESTAALAIDGFLEALAKLMKMLESLGANVVAACDWEERLPGAGRLGPAFA
jgi:hypothetical protein